MAVFLGAAKYVVGLLWHSSIWNFLMKNKEKNQAHEELIQPMQIYRALFLGTHGLLASDIRIGWIVRNFPGLALGSSCGSCAWVKLWKRIGCVQIAMLFSLKFNFVNSRCCLVRCRVVQKEINVTLSYSKQTVTPPRDGRNSKFFVFVFVCFLFVCLFVCLLACLFVCFVLFFGFFFSFWFWVFFFNYYYFFGWVLICFWSLCFFVHFVFCFCFCFLLFSSFCRIKPFVFTRIQCKYAHVHKKKKEKKISAFPNQNDSLLVWSSGKNY